MEILGSIVSRNKVKETVGFVEVVNDIKKVSDPTKPILIIGLTDAKQHIDNFSILEKRISDNLFWTYGRTEKRDDHEKDLHKFYCYVLENAIKDIKYYYINLLKIGYNKIKKLLNILNNDDLKYIYIINDMVYIYYKQSIFGISLEIASWIGVKKQKIFSLLHRNIKNVIKYNKSFVSHDVNKILNNKKYVTPYFMSIESMTNET